MDKERLAKYWTESGIIRDKRIIEAFNSVPRERFVLKEYEAEAYADYALPIIEGQTISQPSTIMIMIQAIEPKKEDNVLEIGTGSGYNAALLSKLVRKVITTEIIPQLINYAEKNLRNAGIKNVDVVLADGSTGYDKEAPYDKIIVTAACPEIPLPLIEQLKENGIIVAPVGPLYAQKMLRGVKKKGRLVIEDLGHFVFVPLKGRYGY